MPGRYWHIAGVLGVEAFEDVSQWGKFSLSHVWSWKVAALTKITSSSLWIRGQLHEIAKICYLIEDVNGYESIQTALNNLKDETERWLQVNFDTWRQQSLTAISTGELTYVLTYSQWALLVSQCDDFIVGSATRNQWLSSKKTAANWWWWHSNRN